MLKPHLKLNSLGPLTAGLIGLLLVVTLTALHKLEAQALWPLAWLFPLALYDLQKRAVPHMAFVAVPGLLAIGLVLARGDWTLATTALVVVAASERHHLPERLRRLALIPTGLGCLVLLGLTPFEQSPGAIGILAFWLAYELGWWAGADALSAIALTLLWPNILWFVSLAAAHVMLGFFYRRGRVLAFPKPLSASELEQIGVAGLPVIAIGAALCILWQAGSA